MRLVVAVLAALLAGNHALPAGGEGPPEVEVLRCVVEVLTKTQQDQRCKDILQAGVKHASPDTNDVEATREETVPTAIPTAGGLTKERIERFLKTVVSKREAPEYERSQESWSLGDEREKRRADEDLEEEEEEEEEGEREKRRDWRPGRYHQRRQKRGEAEEEEEEDNQRSQESWGVEKRSGEEGEEEREKRKWRPGRYHQKNHKRDEESLGDDGGEPEEERSQEAWDVDKRGQDEEERYKRVWKPTHRYHHKKKIHKRGDEEEDYDRSQESWGLDDERDKREWRPGRFHQRRHKRDEELPEEPREEPDEERSQESWDFDTGREKRNWRPGRFHQRRHKRDEELSEEAADEPDEERSQESWDFDKRGVDEEQEVEKRIWKPTHRYHHKKKYHKRGGGGGGGGGSSEEETGGDSDDLDKDETLRYLLQKRNPWIYRGFYHPAWYKRDSDQPAVTPDKVEELTKLLSHRMNQLAEDEAKTGLRQRALTPQEEKALENLAAMDLELQKIAAKLHDNSQ